MRSPDRQAWIRIDARPDIRATLESVRSASHNLDLDIVIDERLTSRCPNADRQRINSARSAASYAALHRTPWPDFISPNRQFVRRNDLVRDRQIARRVLRDRRRASQQFAGVKSTREVDGNISRFRRSLLLNFRRANSHMANRRAQPLAISPWPYSLVP